jgi:hypothetical protein
VAVIHQRRLRIVGIGERPVFEATGEHAEGKAIWVLRDGDGQIENIGFSGARVPSGHGAGIRFEKGPDDEASYEIDLPNGGDVRIEHNTLVQSPLTQNTTLPSYGAEGAAWPDSRLLVQHKRFINQHAAGGRFIQVWADRLPAGTPVRSVHNQLAGAG